MLLRTPLETALNDLLVLSEDAADAYDSAAQAIEDGSLAALLRDFARQRHGIARGLRARVREQGDIPRSPDPDFEAARALFGRLKALFAPDQRRSLLEHCAAADRDLIDRLAEARAVAVDPALLTEIERLQGELQAGLARIAAEEARLQDAG